MKRVLVLTSVCVVLTASLSGCGVWRAYKDFSYRIGEKMPTWGDTPACEGRSFCFGGSPPPARSPARAEPGAMQALAPATQPQGDAPPMPQGAQTMTPLSQRYDIHSATERPLPAPPSPPSHYGNYPQAQPTPPQNTAGAWTPPANWDPAGIGRSATKAPTGGGGTEADAAYNQMRMQAGLEPLAPEQQAPPIYQSAPLKPHEEHPEWKYKMDESPYNELMRSIDSDNRAYHGF